MEQNEQPNFKKKAVMIGKKQIEHWHVIALVLIIYDYVAVCAAYFLALWLRFDGSFNEIPKRFFDPYARFIFPFAAVSILIFLLCRMYNSMWRYASYTELMRTLLGSVISSVLHTILITVFLRRMPLSYYILGAGIQFVFLLLVRFGFRFIQIMNRWKKGPSGS